VKASNPLIRNRLAREITAVLLFKALALTALYFAFFADAQPARNFSPFSPAGEHRANASGDVQ
jgi:hypothetical protein